jgi:hypothetical protein
VATTRVWRTSAKGAGIIGAPFCHCPTVLERVQRVSEPLLALAPVTPPRICAGVSEMIVRRGGDLLLVLAFAFSNRSRVAYRGGARHRHIAQS